MVTLAERTPGSEAAQLEADLRRAGIEPFAWVINACMAATGTRDPVLQRRALAELDQIARARRDHATHVAIVPWLTEEPVGPEELARMVVPQSPSTTNPAPVPW